MNTISCNFCLLLVVFSCVVSAEPVTVPLGKAVKDGLVRCDVKGHKDPSVNYKMITAVIKNLQNKPLNILLESGRTFRCSDTTQQDVIVMQQQLFALGASGSKEIPLFSMCIEMHDSYPAAGIDFAMGDMGDEKLIQMVNLVERKKWFNSAAQAAVWCITDNNSLLNISDPDTAITNELRKLTSRLTGQKLVLAGEEWGDWYEPAPPPLPRISFKGEWEFSITGPSHILIALFDDQKKLVETIVDEQVTDTGHYKYTFTTSAIEVRSKYYEVSLIVNGKVLQTQRHDM